MAHNLARQVNRRRDSFARRTFDPMEERLACEEPEG